jgi:hypothetical protein
MEGITEANQEAVTSTKGSSHPNSIDAQRKRIRNYLEEHGSASTIELRHDLDVLAPAARIYELRHKEGCDIETVTVQENNPGGGSHLVARYFLRESS